MQRTGLASTQVRALCLVKGGRCDLPKIPITFAGMPPSAPPQRSTSAVPAVFRAGWVRFACLLWAAGWAGNGALWSQTQPASTGHDAVFGEGVDVVLTDAARFHVLVHSQGAGVGFLRGKYKGAFRTVGWQGDLVFVRHPKEEKTRNPAYEDGLPYVFGKVNAHHALRIQRYREDVTAEKFRKSGVTVAHVQSYGAVVGISKPVYLEIGYPEIPYTSIQVERYDPLVHFSDRIYGRAPWVNGLDSLALNPGVTLGQRLGFEFHDARNTTRTLEAGVQLDVYAMPVEILAAAFVPARWAHLTFTLCYAWGAQWSAKGLDGVRP